MLPDGSVEEKDNALSGNDDDSDNDSDNDTDHEPLDDVRLMEGAKRLLLSS